MPQEARKFTTVELGPLSGSLDVRSLPHEVAVGNFRWSENITMAARNRPCRRPGYEKLFTEQSPFNNQDLHDQLEGDRQPITFLFESRSTTGVTRLLAGTQNRIYALDSSTGNWTVLSDLLGGTPVAVCTDRVWSAAQIDDIVVLTNGYDQPVYWTFDAPPTGIQNQAVASVADLTNIGVTRAQVVASWKGLMLLGNVTSDGVRVTNRIVWSDFKKPLSFVPQTGSVAGTHDLGPGEDILAMLPLADSLLIYTLRGIWEAQVTGTDDVLSFRQRYSEPLAGAACLAYKRTLISTGDGHLYFGRDGLYAYNMYTSHPLRVDWIHRASSIIFDELEDSLCSLHVAGYNPQKREAWFSWARKGDTNRCPYRTLIVNVEYQFCDVVRRGFSAFANFSPTSSSSLRQFLVDNCVCTSSEIDASEQAPGTEGGYCVVPSDVSGCGAPVSSIYSTGSTTFKGITTENIDAVSADGDSLCAKLGNLTVDQLCAEEQSTQACSAAQRFVMASTFDIALKQYGGIYGYEDCTNHAVCGVYALVGYDSILRSGPLDFKAPNAEKYINRFLVNYSAEFQTVPTNLVARVGFARQPSDPNTDDCAIMWRVLPTKALTCASSKTAAQHATANTRPYLAMEWPLFMGGRFVYWEIKISGLGGASCYSGINMNVSLLGMKY